MFTISETLDKKLQEMDFLEYLKSMHSWLEGIRHRNKSNTAHTECIDLANHIRNRIVKEYKLSWEEFDTGIGNNLRQSADILDLYSFKESDKRKSARIKEFIDDYTFDLHNIILSRERHKKDSDTSVKDEKI